MAKGMTFAIIVLITISATDLYKSTLYPLKNRFSRMSRATHAGMSGNFLVVEAVENFVTIYDAA